MVGANYMGGKRNAAKARTRDTTGRAEKRFFGRQRLKLALGCNATTVQKGAVSAGSISDINLAHAKRGTEETYNRNEYIPDPIHVSPCTPKSKLRLSKLSSEGESSDDCRNRPSKVLQALDTSEPISLRAAMNKLLSMKDLAGLTTWQDQKKCIKIKTVKRPASSSSPCPHSPNLKRKNTGYLPVSPQSTSQATVLTSPYPRRSRSITSSEDDNRFSMGADASDGEVERNYDDHKTFAPSWNIDEAQSYSMCSKEEGQHISSNLCSPNSASSGSRAILYSSGEQLTSCSNNSQHSSRRFSNHYVHPDVNSSPYSQSRSLQSLSSDSLPSFSGNIFDYEDPWKAVGVVLGVEKMSSYSPVKKRDFAMLLEGIPEKDDSDEFTENTWHGRDGGPQSVERYLPRQRSSSAICGDSVSDRYASSSSPSNSIRAVPFPAFPRSYPAHHKPRRFAGPLTSSRRIMERYHDTLVPYSGSESGSNRSSDAPYTPTRGRDQEYARRELSTRRMGVFMDQDSSKLMYETAVQPVDDEEGAGEAYIIEEAEDLESQRQLQGIGISSPVFASPSRSCLVPSRPQSLGCHDVESLFCCSPERTDLLYDPPMEQRITSLSTATSSPCPATGGSSRTNTREVTATFLEDGDEGGRMDPQLPIEDGRSFAVAPNDADFKATQLTPFSSRQPGPVRPCNPEPQAFFKSLTGTTDLEQEINLAKIAPRLTTASSPHTPAGSSSSPMLKFCLSAKSKVTSNNVTSNPPAFASNSPLAQRHVTDNAHAPLDSGPIPNYLNDKIKNGESLVQTTFTSPAQCNSPTFNANAFDTKPTLLAAHANATAKFKNRSISPKSDLNPSLPLVRQDTCSPRKSLIFLPQERCDNAPFDQETTEGIGRDVGLLPEEDSSNLPGHLPVVKMNDSETQIHCSTLSANQVNLTGGLTNVRVGQEMHTSVLVQGPRLFADDDDDEEDDAD